MATLQDTREQEAWWDQLMAELHALEERVHYAVTLHQLMNQRSHIGIPVQYERLFLRARGGQKENSYDHSRGLRQSKRRGIPHTRV